MLLQVTKKNGRFKVEYILGGTFTVDLVTGEEILTGGIVCAEAIHFRLSDAVQRVYTGMHYFLRTLELINESQLTESYSRVRAHLRKILGKEPK